MDLRKLKTMIELVQQSGISELEVTEGEERVRIVRGPISQPHETTYVLAQPTLGTTQAIAPIPAAPVAAPQAAAAPTED